MSLLDLALPIQRPFWAAPGLEWFRIGHRLVGFRGEINGVHHCVIGDQKTELGSLSYAIWKGRA